MALFPLEPTYALDGKMLALKTSLGQVPLVVQEGVVVFAVSETLTVTVPGEPEAVAVLGVPANVTP
jgi:hypothetical protein